MKIVFGRPNIPDQNVFLDRVKDILQSRRLTNHGPVVDELEKSLSEYLSVKHVVCVCNATIGLLVAAKVLNLEKEVILPSFSFVASAHALQWQGIKPVFCDIDPTTHNIDPDKIEALITENTTGIMGVHIWGRPCNHDKLLSIARKHGLKLLYDAAHAFGTTYGGCSVAALEDMSVLSFHATKSFHTFEGGAIVTNDDDLARKARLMINYCFQGFDNVVGLGINAKMSEIHAAMGLCNLDVYNAIVEHNKSVYQVYQNELSSISGIFLAEYNPTEKNNYHYIVIEVDEQSYGMNRDRLQEILSDHDILSRRYFYPGIHKSLPYSDLFPDVNLPITDELCDRVLVLPSGSSTDELADIHDIICLIKNKN